MNSKKIPTKVSEVKLSYKSRTKAADRPQVTRSYTAYQVLRENWDEDTIALFEEFHVLLLDRANRIMGRYPCSQGSMIGTIVDPRMVFTVALKMRAASLIVAHNHPSTRLVPSEADKELTKRLVKAGEILGIPILDHLILSPEGGYFSFLDEGLI